MKTIRRDGVLRALPSDVNLAVGVVMIREKKRDKRKLTTRRVPMTPFLKGVLADWMQLRAEGKTLFCKGDGKAITPREAHNYFQRGLRLSKWGVMKGWHVFRHSFISALASKGVDQRIIDDLVGHATVPAAALAAPVPRRESTGGARGVRLKDSGGDPHQSK